MKPVKPSKSSKIRQTLESLHGVLGGDLKGAKKWTLNLFYLGFALKDIWFPETTAAFLRKHAPHRHKENTEFIYNACVSAMKPEVVWGEGEGERIEKFEIDGEEYFFVKHDSWLYPGFHSSQEDLTHWRAWFWDTFGPRCTFRMNKGDSEWSWKAYPEKYPMSSGEFFGEDNEKILLDVWEAYQREGMSRSMLFEGPPGTGKTTLALRLARAMQGTVLHLPANLFGYSWDAATAMRVFQLLRPAIVIIEDIHTLGTSTTKNLIHLLEWAPHVIKDETLLIATTNRLEDLSDALRRPGRFDEIKSFVPPDAEKRALVLRGYISKYACKSAFREAFLEDVVEKTEGLTEAYLHEIVRSGKACQTLYSPDTLEKEIMSKIENMCRIGVKKTEGGADAPATEGVAKALKDAT